MKLLAATSVNVEGCLCQLLMLEDDVQEVHAASAMAKKPLLSGKEEADAAILDIDMPVKTGPLMFWRVDP